MATEEERIDALKERGEMAQVSAQNQPPAELKKLGWARKKLLQEVLQCRVPGSNKFQLKKLAGLFDMAPEQLTMELAINLAQIAKALKGDTPAYKALMNRGYGHPAPYVERDKENVKLEIVYGNKPVYDIPRVEG